MAKILLIEDNEALCKLMLQVLKGAGHDAHGAADGEEGLRLFRRGHYDLVVTDILMPRCDGLEAIRDMRRHKKWATRILAISGGGTKLANDYLPIAERFGADRTLSKPFRPHEFLKVVDSLLHHAGPGGRPH